MLSSVWEKEGFLRPVAIKWGRGNLPLAMYGVKMKKKNKKNLRKFLFLIYKWLSHVYIYVFPKVFFNTRRCWETCEKNIWGISTVHFIIYIKDRDGELGLRLAMELIPNNSLKMKFSSVFTYQLIMTVFFCFSSVSTFRTFVMYHGHWRRWTWSFILN